MMLYYYWVNDKQDKLLFYSKLLNDVMKFIDKHRDEVGSSYYYANDLVIVQTGGIYKSSEPIPDLDSEAVRVAFGLDE
jgi:hypothetical protein